MPVSPSEPYPIELQKNTACTPEAATAPAAPVISLKRLDIGRNREFLRALQSGFQRAEVVYNSRNNIFVPRKKVKQ